MRRIWTRIHRAVFVSTLLAHVAVTARASVRVMPLGDSITQGDDRHNTYRRPLWNKLRNANFDVDFVGTFNTQFGGGQPPNPDFDLDHQGEWGRQAREVLPKVKGYAEAARPDIVLLHLGTNDVRTGHTVDQALESLGQIVDVLRSVNPSITVLMAAITPSDPSDPTHDIMQSLSAAIPALAAQKDTAQSRVVLVDQNTGFDARSDTYDGLHPNETGEEKMAQKWFAALAPLLQGLPPQPPTTTPAPPTNTPTTPTTPSSPTGPAPATPARVTNAASFEGGPVAPGEIVTLWGTGFGPTAAASFRLSPANSIDSTLAEMRVLFDGLPSPLIYVSGGQINAVVPYGIAGQAETQVQVEYKGVRSERLRLAVAPAVPGIFTTSSNGQGAGAILNQDTRPNTAANPAARGSIVVLYVTGEGPLNPAGKDGAVAQDPLPKPVLPVTVSIGDREAEVLYAGAAPGLVSGMLQVNARVPLETRTGSAVPVVVKVGPWPSQGGVTMAVQ